MLHRLALLLTLLAILTVTAVAPVAAQEMPTVMPNNYVLSDILNEQRAESAISARRLGDAAVIRFRNEMGLDLRRLQLTSAGFVPSR
ncbi:hypothetical protein LJR225_004879 [Phenylobacterium sp. LjRoot225]|uniref:hypothetical protein n=1 Tax=Phenylobacterium sp. LjRoot225 TaxID=3342285 RepID=UPI003ED02614